MRKPDERRKALLRTTTVHDCCYYKSDRPGTIHIKNANPDNEWICDYHRDKWNAHRDRFLADGLPCEMRHL